MIQTASLTRHATAIAATGDHAPTSGWWRLNDEPQLRYLQQGETMPSLAGSPALWTLVRELPPSRHMHQQRAFAQTA